MLISSALVLLMTPGLAFFYGGLVRSRNVLRHHDDEFGGHGRHRCNLGVVGL
jgi:ammonia channel protein AmtB